MVLIRALVYGESMISSSDELVEVVMDLFYHTLWYTHDVIIFSTDSGIERTGYAFFNKNSSSHRLLHYGCIITKRNFQLAARIKKIYDDISSLFKKHHPDILIIEQLFFNTNQKTVVSIAQSQGILLLLAAQYDIPIEFLTPIQIKYILTGYGRSDKKNVQKMVRLLLSLEKMPEPDDVVDAIACGLAYCQMNQMLK